MDLAMLLKFLEQLGHQHGILSAGNADRDPIPLLDQLIVPYRTCKTAEQLFMELLTDALFDPLLSF